VFDSDADMPIFAFDCKKQSNLREDREPNYDYYQDKDIDLLKTLSKHVDKGLHAHKSGGNMRWVNGKLIDVTQAIQENNLTQIKSGAFTLQVFYLHQVF
jgi:hypothetical protein